MSARCFWATTQQLKDSMQIEYRICTPVAVDHIAACLRGAMRDNLFKAVQETPTQVVLKPERNIPGCLILIAKAPTNSLPQI